MRGAQVSCGPLVRSARDLLVYLSTCPEHGPARNTPSSSLRASSASSIRGAGGGHAVAAPAAPPPRRAPPRRAARRAASNKGDAAISIRSAPCWGGEPHSLPARGAPPPPPPPPPPSAQAASGRDETDARKSSRVYQVRVRRRTCACAHAHALIRIQLLCLNLEGKVTSRTACIHTPTATRDSDPTATQTHSSPPLARPRDTVATALK